MASGARLRRAGVTDGTLGETGADADGEIGGASNNPTAGFSVDTGLFRQLGELLVGRDATALAELVKNAYDADATEVVLTATGLDDPAGGTLTLIDDGIGMTLAQFRRGFLRVAGRTKTVDGRVSPVFGRRYTGEKGVGRLAAHKLASDVQVLSVAAVAADGDAAVAALRAEHPKWSPARLQKALDACDHTVVDGHIDWDAIELFETLDQVDASALTLVAQRLEVSAARGTTVTLRRLRRTWTDVELAEAARQLSNFEPPAFLVRPLPERLVAERILFSTPTVRDATREDPGMTLRLEGDLGVPTDFWSSVERTAEWVLEIRADRGKDIEYAVVPTAPERATNPHSAPVHAIAPHPAPTEGPFFHARILVRSGGTPTVAETSWAATSSGVRVYLEGFRVLPYGEPGNDWLSLDSAYTRRGGRFVLDPLLAGRGESLDALRELTNRDVGLRLLPNRSFFGAVFLTDAGATSLRTLVNREGFVPDAHFETLTNLVRRGTDLVLRARALASLLDKQQKDREKAAAAASESATGADEPQPDAEDDADSAAAGDAPDQGSAAAETDDAADSGGSDDDREYGGDDRPPLDAEAWRTGRRGSAARLLDAVRGLEVALPNPAPEAVTRATAEVRSAADALASDASLLRVLASVGAQLAAFHHEVQHMLPAARNVERYLKPRPGQQLPDGVAAARVDMTQLRRSLERQASYLADVVSAESRERRTRQVLRDRLDIAARTVQGAAAELSVTLDNEVPGDLRTPPMFPAEVLAVLTNLMTNAVKAAGRGGRVLATATAPTRDRLVLRLENTGVAVHPDDGERWFVPFASTSASVDTTLGQGTGLGLPIVRDLLTEYGGAVRFVQPSEGFATAVEVTFVA
jgi:signal transduction histidine kinase